MLRGGADMVFSSLVFLYIFLPAVLLCYFLCPARYRLIVLLLFSLAFYGFGEPLYLAVMLLSITANYFFGARVGRLRVQAPDKAKRLVGWSVAFNLLVLCFFKYTDFFIENLALLPIWQGRLRPLGVALPLGISFYTFQSMSYAIDVYRGDADVQKSYTKFALYVSLFPQLIAGPIVRYKTIAEQLDARRENIEKFRSGVVCFMIGLAKKVLLANAFGQLWETFSALPDGSRSVMGAWIGILAYTFQIYFDFGGYSDMAIGLGRMFGFDFQINFNYPYLSRSVTEFWGRRWHISLGTWFKEYLYIPLGGNRCSVPRHILNLAIVWLLTGFWHGASWNFVLWGAYYALLLIVEKYGLRGVLDKLPKALTVLYTFFLVMMGWVIFALPSLSAIGGYLSSLFCVREAGLIDDAARYALKQWLPLLTVGFVACTPLCRDGFRRLKACLPRLYEVSEAVLCLLGLILCTAYIVDASYNPFLYFRF